jgi:uncharacterized membrane protein
VTDRTRLAYIQGFVLAASAVGLGVSAYLTSVHYSTAQLVCTVGGPVNCERVLGSGYAVVAGTGIPTSAAGIVWFAVSGLLALGVRLGVDARRLSAAQVAWSALGLLTVVYLLFVEIVLVGALCLWCTAVYVLVVAIFLITVTIRQPSSEPGH